MLTAWPDGRLGVGGRNGDEVSEGLEFVLRAALIGIGATAVMDLWAAFQKLVFGVPSLDYGMVGRWMGHIARGRFVHESIGKSSAVRGERAIGWGAHYAIGIAFAGLLVAIWGLDWAYRPTPLPALIIGLLTIVAPFFILQPGMGAGIAASRTPKPNLARLRSLVAHMSFAVGLYASALLWAALMA
jgi:Protein of unknown function (DUF2938)